MASFSGGFFNLASLLGGLSELGTVKKHLFRASREILLAVNGLLGFADQYVSGLTTETSRQEMIRAAIHYARTTLKTLARQLPRGGDEEEYRTLHQKVMGSILEVLEGEIRKNAKSTGPKAKMKIEVFEAIRNVLLKEMEEPFVSRS